MTIRVVFIFFFMLSFSYAFAQKMASFPTESSIVYVDVTQKEENPVALPDLSVEDFAIREKGAAENSPVAFFKHQNMPLDVTIMVDLSGSMNNYLPAIRRAALELIHAIFPVDATGQQLPSQDRIQIVAFDELPQYTGFHDNRGHLEQAVNSLYVPQDNNKGTAILRSLYIVGTTMPRLATREAQRRRAIVLLSDGDDTMDTSLVPVASVSEDDVKRRFNDSRILLYTVFIGTVRKKDDRDQKQVMRGERARSFMKQIAESTGAKFFMPESFTDLDKLAKDLHGFYQKINTELHNQYTLGFIPQNCSEDKPENRKQWHRIFVTTKAYPVNWRHRESYYCR